LDPGISGIFSSRLQETVYEPGNINASSQVKQIKKQPDRIHGLQLTHNFDRLLEAAYAHDEPERYPPRTIGDVINTTVTSHNVGDPLLFPFLVLEAKRDKDGQSFQQIELQTAFPIRNMLKLQYDLAKTPGNNREVPGGPLVWFMANRGEEWRVYGAVINEEEDRLNYVSIC
jgi:hypothetical protein